MTRPRSRSLPYSATSHARIRARVDHGVTDAEIAMEMPAELCVRDRFLTIRRYGAAKCNTAAEVSWAELLVFRILKGRLEYRVHTVHN